MFAPTVAKASALTAPMAQGLLLGTKVLTMEGEMPVEYLSAGDRIITRNGCRKLVDISTALVTNLTIVRISEGVLAKDTPATDLLVTPDQAVLVRDWRAKAMAGVARAMIAAERLVDGEYIRREVLPEARLFSLHFEEEAVIYAGSVELACPMIAVAA